MTPIGLLVMAYGGPESVEDVEPYLRDVRGFRETPRAMIEEVRERYALIGGRSPIVDRTRTQAEALRRALNDDRLMFDVEVGMRHWHPYIGDALVRLERRGVERAVGLVMAPHYSLMSIAKYFQEVADAGTNLNVLAINEWHLLPGYIEAVTGRVRAGLRRFPEERRDVVHVVFTAHSLPERIRQSGDPYPAQLAESVAAVVERLENCPHAFAYQSAAMTPEPWLGPDVADVVRQLAAAGTRDVLVAPIGFVCDHVEILYDIDIDLRREAEALGVRLERIEMLNDDTTMITGLADLVRRRVTDAGWS